MCRKKLLLVFFVVSMQLFAQKADTSDVLKFKLMADGTEFVQGQMATLFYEILNYDPDAKFFPTGQYFLVKKRFINGSYYDEMHIINTLQSNTLLLKSNITGLPLAPRYMSDWIWFEIDLPEIAWPVANDGDYEVFIARAFSHEKIEEVVSDTIRFSVKKVPDSLKTAFKNLDKKKEYFDKSTMINQDAERKYNKYKNTLYEKEFYFKLTESYIEALSFNNLPEKKRKNVENSIIGFFEKYPNDYHSFDLIYKLIHKDKFDSINPKFFQKLINVIFKIDPQKLTFGKNYLKEFINKLRFNRKYTYLNSYNFPE